jgi:ABC-type multidrug transport system ATPase subunit
LIRSLLKPAKIYVFDEPFNFLDKQNTLKAWSKILKLKEEGKTVLVISH